MARNRILTGGHTHSFPHAAPALAQLLAAYGIESAMDFDIDAGLAAVDRERPELLTVYALRWTMQVGDKYAPYRAKWSYRLSEPGRAAFESHLARGGGLLALHTAVICFDDWPAWNRILGGTWQWGRSSHPPVGRVAVKPADVADPVVAGLPAFEIVDEVYGDLDFAQRVQPLFVAQAIAGDWQPVAWKHGVGKGRVVVDTLGHSADAFSHPVHRRLVARAALWAIGRPDAEVERV